MGLLDSSHWVLCLIKLPVDWSWHIWITVDEESLRGVIGYDI